MPFDGTGDEGRIHSLEKIEKVIDLLAHEDRWCKRELVSRDGRRCIMGAVQYADATAELKLPILKAIRQVTGVHHLQIEAFNDAPSTTHALVLRVLHQARDNILTGAADYRANGRLQQQLGTWGTMLTRPLAYLHGWFG